MSEETMPEKIWARPHVVNDNGLVMPYMTHDRDKAAKEYLCADGETITELRRQNAALKEFVNFILFSNSGESKVIDKGRELSIIVDKIATEKDIALGLENDIGDEIIGVADWMLTDTAAIDYFEPKTSDEYIHAVAKALAYVDCDSVNDCLALSDTMRDVKVDSLPPKIPQPAPSKADVAREFLELLCDRSPLAVRADGLQRKVKSYGEEILKEWEDAESK